MATKAVKTVHEVREAIPPVLGGLVGLGAAAGVAGLVGRLVPPTAKFAEPIGSGVVVLASAVVAAGTKGPLRDFVIGMAVGAFLDLLLEIARLFYPAVGQLPWPGFRS